MKTYLELCDVWSEALMNDVTLFSRTLFSRPPEEPFLPWRRVGELRPGLTREQAYDEAAEAYAK